MSSHSFDRKYSNSGMVGIAGIKCPCCFPSLRGKRKWLRAIKRRGKQLSRKSINRQIDEAMET